MQPLADSKMPALTSSSLYLPIAASNCSLGIAPASDSFVALTITITFIAESPFWGSLASYPVTGSASRVVIGSKVLSRSSRNRSPPHSSIPKITGKRVGNQPRRHADGPTRHAQVARQQDGAEDRGAGNQIEDRAGCQYDSQTDEDGFGITEPASGFQHRGRLHEFHGRIEEQKSRRQATQDAPPSRAASSNELWLYKRLACVFAPTP